MNVGGATANVDGAVRRDVRHPRHGQPRRLRLRRCAAARGPRRRRRVRRHGPQRRARPAWAGSTRAFGVFGVNAHYALAARRHMAMYGTTNDHLGAIAVAERAVGDDEPARRAPRADHDRGLPRVALGRRAAAPARLLPRLERRRRRHRLARRRGEGPARSRRRTSGAWGRGTPATCAARAGTSRRRPARRCRRRRRSRWPASASRTSTSCRRTTATPTPCSSRSRTTASARRARAARSSPTASSRPGGALPTNTGGGQLSAYYMWGMTPLSEGVIQARGQGGERQVDEARRRARDRQRRHPRPPQHARAVAARERERQRSDGASPSTSSEQMALELPGVELSARATARPDSTP